MRLRAALLVLVFAVVGLAVPAQAVEPELTVTWPTMTNFNPDTTAYTFTVDYTGPGTLRAVWNGWTQPVASAGEHTMVFDVDAELSSIRIDYCLGAAECHTLSYSPELSVVRGLVVGATIDRPTRAPGDPLEARMQVDSPRYVVSGSPSTLSWSVRRQIDDAEVANGAIPPWEYQSSISVHIPMPELPQGDYYLRLDVSMDTTDYGHLAGSGQAAFVVDTSGPRLGLHTDSAALYPFHDRYRDSLRISYGTNEFARIVLEVLNDRGGLVKTLHSKYMFDDSSDIAGWMGRDAAGDLVANGTYEIRLSGTDEVGNESTRSVSITVSDKHLVTKTFVRRVSAARSLVSKFVGKCSSLKQPSLHGWNGSLGLYSQTKCKKSAQSGVQTLHGLYIPKAVEQNWFDFRVNVYGGAARTNKNSYLILGYLREDTGFSRRTIAQFGPKVGNHIGDLISDRNYIFDRDTRPYVIWSTGLTQGSRYDIKSFTVRLKYYALQ